MHQVTRPQQRIRGLWVLGILALIVGIGLVATRLMHRSSAAPPQDQAGLFADQPNTALLLSSTSHATIISTPTPIPSSIPSPIPSPTPIPIIVYISGAVRQPNVYELPANARVNDVVLAAGGFVHDADLQHINLAAHIHDAEHIHIPQQGETVTLPTAAAPANIANTNTTNTANTGTNISNTTASYPININTATADELQELKGIGQVIANRIIEYRLSHGRFTSLEELQHVQGVSLAMVEELRPSLTIGQ